MLIKKTTSPSEIHSLEFHNWIRADEVMVSFSIGHDGSSIFLNYQVEEPQVRAVNTEFNSSVWEDSCVEFFFSPDGTNYYNFEINAIGTILCAYGKDRYEREHLSGSILSKISTAPSLGRNPITELRGRIKWSLQVIIPVEVLIFSQIEDLSGLEGRGNFYKCGDKLDQPHYLSWSKVNNPTPDFHLSEHFGPLSFQ